MAGELKFTLSIVDRMSAPAKAMAANLRTVESQLRAIKDAAGDISKLSLKIPTALSSVPTKAARGATEKIGPMLGPGRKEADRAARYAEKLQIKTAKEAERAQKAASKEIERQEKQRLRAVTSLDKQRSSTLMRQFKAEERAKLKLETKAAKEAADIRKKALSHLEVPGAKGALKDISQFAGASEGTAAAIGTVGFAAAATVASVLALGAAFAYVTYSSASLAIHASEAKNDTLDMLEAMLGSQEAANSTYKEINNISKRIAISQEAAGTLARELTAAGVTNQSMLLDAVESIAEVESVLKGAGGKIQGIIEKAAQTGKFELKAKQLVGTGVQLSALYEELAKRTGHGVKQIEGELKKGKIGAEVGIAALTSVLDKKFGGVAAKQAMDIGAQFQRFKDNVSRLFEDVNAEPFLAALDKILSLADQATPAGAAMHDVFTSVFDGLFRAVAVVEPYVKAFFKGLIIIGLQLAIAFKPLMKQLGMTFGGDQQSNAMKLAKVMSLIGQAVGYVAGKFVALITNTTVWNTLGYALKGIIGVIVGGFALAAVVIAPFVAATAAAGAAIAAIGIAISAAVGWLGTIGPAALSAGKNIVLGLVDGIKSAASYLYQAVVNLASGALKKFKDVFGIQSPSKVMAGMGVNLSAGLAKGIKAGAGASSSAMVGAGARLGGSVGAGSQLAMLRHMPQHMPGNDNAIRSRAEQPRLVPPSERRAQASTGSVFHPGAFAAGAFVFQFQDSRDFEDRAPEILASVFEKAALMTGTGG